MGQVRGSGKCSQRPGGARAGHSVSRVWPPCRLSFLCPGSLVTGFQETGPGRETAAQGSCVRTARLLCGARREAARARLSLGRAVSCRSPGGPAQAWGPPDQGCPEGMPRPVTGHSVRTIPPPRQEFNLPRHKDIVGSLGLAELQAWPPGFCWGSATWLEQPRPLRKQTDTHSLAAAARPSAERTTQSAELRTRRPGSRHRGAP